MPDTLKEIFFSVSQWICQNRENHLPTSQGIYSSAIAGNLYYHLQIYDKRFGVLSGSPIGKSAVGELKVLPKPEDHKAYVTLRSLATRKELSIEMSAYLPRGLPENYPGLKYRLASEFIEIIVPVRRDGQPKFNFKFPESEKRHSIIELAKVAELILFLDENSKAGSFDIIINYDCKRLSYGQIRFPVFFSQETKTVSQGIIDAYEITKRLSITKCNITISQIFNQAIELRFIAQTYTNDHSYVLITFSSVGDFKYQKEYVVPRLHVVNIGDWKCIFGIAIFARLVEIEPESNCMNRIKMNAEKSTIFKSAYVKLNEKHKITPKSLIADMVGHYENEYDIVLLQE